MSKTNYPITPAIRFLREKNIKFIPHLYSYEEHGGTEHAAKSLNIPHHNTIKTIVLENESRQGLIVLMFGDKHISTRNLARQLNMKHIEAASPQQANRWTGYLVGGTSPFGLKTPLDIYVEVGILELDKIYINGGKRGFLVEISPEDLKSLNFRTVEVISE